MSVGGDRVEIIWARKIIIITIMNNFKETLRS